LARWRFLHFTCSCCCSSSLGAVGMGLRGTRLSAIALMALADEQMTGMLYPSIDWAGFDPAMGTVQAVGAARSC
jgi:hypothetical protein